MRLAGCSATCLTSRELYQFSDPCGFSSNGQGRLLFVDHSTMRLSHSQIEDGQNQVPVGASTIRARVSIHSRSPEESFQHLYERSREIWKLGIDPGVFAATRLLKRQIGHCIGERVSTEASSTVRCRIAARRSNRCEPDTLPAVRTRAFQNRPGSRDSQTGRAARRRRHVLLRLLFGATLLLTLCSRRIAVPYATPTSGARWL